MAHVSHMYQFPVQADMQYVSADTGISPSQASIDCCAALHCQKTGPT